MKRALAAVLLVACTSGQSASGDRDGASPFTADPAPDGPAVYVRGRGDASNVVLDVVARGAPDVHGTALRVTFDPDALTFVEAAAAPVWTRRSMALAKEGSPGQLAIAWFAKGERGFAANDETVLGTLTFATKSKKESAIAFRAERSAIVDRQGRPLDVVFRGGRVSPR